MQTNSKFQIYNLINLLFENSIFDQKLDQFSNINSIIHQKLLIFVIYSHTFFNQDPLFIL